MAGRGLGCATQPGSDSSVVLGRNGSLPPDSFRAHQTPTTTEERGPSPDIVTVTALSKGIKIGKLLMSSGRPRAQLRCCPLEGLSEPSAYAGSLTSIQADRPTAGRVRRQLRANLSQFRTGGLP